MAVFEIDNIAVPIDFQESDNVLRTLQNAKNLLMTRMGEVPYDRMRGFNQALYDLPIPELNDILIEELDRVLAPEPDAEVVDADAELFSNGQVHITAWINVAGTGEDDEEDDETEDDG